MRLRTIVGAALAAGIGLATTTGGATPAVKSAAVTLKDTVLIAGTFVYGQVVFVHDDNRMARGEPCTTVHRFEAGKGAGEELVAFHCKPRWGKAAEKFTQGTNRNPNGLLVMTEYQFAGDEEAHLVPSR